MPSVKHKRGVKASLPNSSLQAGEIYLTTDRHTSHFAIDATTMAPIVPAIDDLSSAGAVNGATDLILIHDADATGVKERKITFNDFKTALAIPGGSSDELVAVVSGGTPGYVWGTDGSDGIFRMGSTMTWAKDGGNAYVTIDVGTVDCGTF